MRAAALVASGACVEYVAATLGPPVMAIAAEAAHQPSALVGAGASDDIHRLRRYAGMCLDAILASAAACPPLVGRLAACLRAVSRRHFSSDPLWSRAAVGALVFERLFLPAIAMPAEHGLVAARGGGDNDDDATAATGSSGKGVGLPFAAQRDLVLVARVLQRFFTSTGFVEDYLYVETRPLLRLRPDHVLLH